MDNDLSGNMQRKNFESRLSSMIKEVKKTTGQEIAFSRCASVDFAFPSDEQEYH